MERQLPEVIERIREWVRMAGAGDLSLMLRALDVQMTASPEQVQIKGAVYVLSGTVTDDLATTGRTSA